MPTVICSYECKVNLEGMADAAEALAKRPDDGKIRLVNHRAEEIWRDVDDEQLVNTARVMDRSEYLDMMRQHEEQVMRGLFQIHQDRLSGRANPRYENKTFPDCMIMTPNLILTFPRRGVIDLRSNRPDSWNLKTSLPKYTSISGGNRLLEFAPVDSTREDPFNPGLTLNAHSFGFTGLNELVGMSKETLGRTQEELTLLAPAIQEVGDFVNAMNKTHNLTYADEIQYWKDFRSSIRQ